MIALYHQTKTPISFRCRRMQELNPRSLIQPSKTFPVELTRTHHKNKKLRWTHGKKLDSN